MSNTPWNNQGTQTVYMSGIGNSFGFGNSLSQYWSGRDTFFNPDNGGGQYTQGQRAMSSWTNKSWVYIWGQGGTFGSPNGYTNIYINQGQGGATWQSVNMQTYYLARVFIRNFSGFVVGYGGTGGRSWQGSNANPGSYAGTNAFNIQGTASYTLCRVQGTQVWGGGGGGGAGNQGNRANQGLLIQRQFSPAGGGGGGGGAGFGPGGGWPDARYQGQGGTGGGYYAGGAGGNGDRSPAGGKGGDYGQGGTPGQGGGAGSPAGQQLGGGWQGVWIY